MQGSQANASGLWRCMIYNSCFSDILGSRKTSTLHNCWRPAKTCLPKLSPLPIKCLRFPEPALQMQLTADTGQLILSKLVFQPVIQLSEGLLVLLHLWTCDQGQLWRERKNISSRQVAPATSDYDFISISSHFCFYPSFLPSFLILFYFRLVDRSAYVNLQRCSGCNDYGDLIFCQGDGCNIAFCVDSTTEDGQSVPGCLCREEIDAPQKSEQFLCPTCCIRKKIPFQVSTAYSQHFSFILHMRTVDILGEANPSFTCGEHRTIILVVFSFTRTQERPSQTIIEDITEQHIWKRPLGAISRTSDFCTCRAVE